MEISVRSFFIVGIWVLSFVKLRQPKKRLSGSRPSIWTWRWPRLLGGNGVHNARHQTESGFTSPPSNTTQSNLMGSIPWIRDRFDVAHGQCHDRFDINHVLCHDWFEADHWQNSTLVMTCIMLDRFEANNVHPRSRFETTFLDHWWNPDVWIKFGCFIIFGSNPPFWSMFWIRFNFGSNSLFPFRWPQGTTNIS